MKFFSPIYTCGLDDITKSNVCLSLHKSLFISSTLGNLFLTLTSFSGHKMKTAIRLLTCFSLTLSILSGCGPGSTYVKPSPSEEMVGNDEAPLSDAPESSTTTADRELPIPESDAGTAGSDVNAEHQSTTTERPVAEAEPENRQDAHEEKAQELEVVRIEDELAGTLVLIPAGEFLMGTLDSEDESLVIERPQHVVHIKNAFYIGMHEVTYEQFRRFVSATGYVTDAEKDGLGGSGFDAKTQDFITQGKQFSWRNTGFIQKDRNPVVNVSWNDAVAYCHWLTSSYQDYSFRLPTEAEREYVGRAGTTTPFGWGMNPESMIQFENVADQSLFNTISSQSDIRRLCGNWDDGFTFASVVGSFPPNPFGLHDTHGNAGEWCQDVFVEDRYLKPADFVPQTGNKRVFRGGTFLYRPGACRVGRRFGVPPITRRCDIGFRIVRDAAPVETEQALANAESLIEHELAGKLMLIPAGEFLMGSPETDPNAGQSERPRHQVTIQEPFYIGAYEVTFGQFRRFVAESEYITDAEKDGVGGWGYSNEKHDFERPPEKYSWRKTG
ncbi:MAG: SUMF1/EgtB/PvdO family nonheme iron enzyme, partial [Planctomycetaceae bacterium]